MPTYFYSAVKQDGSVKKDKVEAANEAELTKKIEAEGLQLTDYHLASAEEKNQKMTFLDRFQRIKRVQKMFFTQNLRIMVRTGFSLSLALRTLSLQTNNQRFKKVLGQLEKDVESGINLSQSMKKFPDVFSEYFINMIASGEASGRLEEILERLTIQLKKENMLIGKIKNALTYPIIVLIAMVGIGIAMFVMVIPKITEIYKETDAQLPIITRIVIKISDVLNHNLIWFGLGALLFLFLFYRFFKSKAGRRGFDRLFLRLPILKNILKNINLATFSRTLGSLLKTDIPIVETFQIISRILNNHEYREALNKASEKVKVGEPIAKSLGDYPRLFPPMVLQMIAVGEESGTIDEVSQEIAEFYENEVDSTMSNLSTIIEPVLMLILGVAVGGMALAIIMPMYSLADQI